MSEQQIERVSEDAVCGRMVMSVPNLVEVGGVKLTGVDSVGKRKQFFFKITQSYSTPSGL